MSQGRDADRTKMDAGSYIVNCYLCGSRFEATRSDATFCSNRCRLNHSREPKRIAAKVEYFKGVGRSIKDDAPRYKHNKDIFEALIQLQKDINMALGAFENEV